ncbi:MAG: hypothetical protein DRJ60_00275 [Thermoprotei archaeon]|nr:MAG: hypothetical protein DRJ60_00275 [Thermoprotei archaeon]
MDASTLALQAVGGFVAGGLIGYAIRKAAKWILVATGFMLLPVFGLWHLGLVSVNWEGVNELVGKFVGWLGMNLSDMSLVLASAGAFGVSGLLGFFFGISGGFRHSIFPVPTRHFRFVKRKSRSAEERG